MDNSQVGVEFVLYAIDTHTVCLNSSYTDQEEAVMEVEALTMAKESELGLVNLSFPDTAQLM